MKTFLEFHKRADFLRESSGSNIEKALLKALKETKVEIDLLPGGKKMDPGPLTLPVPTNVSAEPQILTMERLISSKLSTYLGRGIERAQDYADVVKLIQANDLPRAYGVDQKMRDFYHKMWDEIHK